MMNALRTGALIGTGLLLAHAASAEVTYQTGFEAPTYTAGPLAGQDDWFSGNGTVETGTVYAGSQAVEFDSTGVAGEAVADRTFFGPGNFVEISEHVLITAADPNVAWELMGVAGNAGLVNQVVIFNGGVFLGSSAAAVPIGVWNQFTIDVDFNNALVTLFLNGSEVGTDGFASPSTSLALIGIGINGASGSATSRAFFDNLSIAAPEPASLALLGAGLAGLGAISRRKR